MQDKISGGLVGLLVGDALGVPYEFHGPHDIPQQGKIDMVPPKGFRAAHRVSAGTYSDDGALALCLLASLNDRGRLDEVDLGQKMVAWMRSGYMAVDRDVFDIGIQTLTALRAIEVGGKLASSAESSNGNGSLMRSLPLALWHQGTDAELVKDAMAQSSLTHAHPRSLACCALYCLWARMTLEASKDPWFEAVIAAKAILDGRQHGELIKVILPACDGPVRGTGYVVDCLASARWAVGFGDYASVVRAAISLGNDTDTTACVAGGIAGVANGLKNIPKKWVAQLRGKEEWWGAELERLLASRK